MPSIRANRQLDERARFGLGWDTQDDETTDLGVEAVVEDEVDGFAPASLSGDFDDLAGLDVFTEAPVEIPAVYDIDDVVAALETLGLITVADPE